MKIYAVAAILLLGISGACAQKEINETSSVSHVTAAEFKNLVELGEGQLIDIRTPGEYLAGHIEGATMIDFYAQGFSSKLDKLDKNIPIYIYCRSGNRTSQTVGLLEQLGFKEIVNLKYGLVEWNQKGYGLVQ